LFASAIPFARRAREKTIKKEIHFDREEEDEEEEK
jgi:hypothetical protein